MENKEKQIENKLNIQEYLSLGYVFLLVLGILYNALYYGFLGINIIDYSSVLDILLSPIAVFLSNKKTAVIIVLFTVVAIVYATSFPKVYKWLRKKKWYQKHYDVEKKDKQLEKYNATETILFIMAIALTGFYVGGGAGKGSRTAQKIQNSKIITNHQIIFNDKETVEVNLLGKNSLYIFYVTPNNKEIQISPIEGNIKKIIKLKDKKGAIEE